MKEWSDASSLVTTTFLNTKFKKIENKMSAFSDLVNKTDYGAKISETEGKYFTASHYNKFTSDILEGKIKQIDLLIYQIS